MIETKQNAGEIVTNFILKNVDLQSLDRNAKIFEEGLVNSLFAIELMTFLEREFEIKIKLEDLDMENFQTVNLITSFVAFKTEGC